MKDGRAVDVDVGVVLVVSIRGVIVVVGSGISIVGVVVGSGVNGGCSGA